MVKKHNINNAFSVLELFFTLFVIIIVVALIFFILGKVKPKKLVLNSNNKNTFACYWECDSSNLNCRLKQTIYEDNIKKEDKDVTMAGSCYFNHEENLQRALLIASGAGSSKNSGQVITDFAPQTYETIIPGKFSSNFDEGITHISSKNILPGIVEDNGLQFENILFCELVSSSDVCPNLKTSLDRFKPTGCEVAKNIDEIPVVKILGCEPDGVNLSDYSIKLSDLVKNKNFLDRLDKEDLAQIGKSQLNNTYIYNFTDSQKQKKTFEFNFKMKDSTYDTRVKYHALNVSHMAEILSNSSVLRQNDLIKKIIKQNPGAPEKNGAVVILW